MTTDTIEARLASGAGRLLGAATRGVAAARRTPKPLHPRGTVSSASISRHGGASTGVAWLDTSGTDRGLVRRSRAVGLPEGWPDVHGLALRVELADGGIADLLLASTGGGPTGRFVLHAGRRPETLFFGSLLPYRSPTGPVLLGALPRDEESWDLLWAPGRGPWKPFGQLRLRSVLPDAEVSFDPVLHRVEGLEQYETVARLRLPAYRTARRSRSDSVGPMSGNADTA